MNPDPNKLLDTTKSLADLANSIGQSLIGKNIHRALNGIFLSVFKPFVLNGIIQQYEIDQFTQGLAYSLEQIQSENLTADNSLMLIKAFEEVRYRMKEPELRDMFIKLISKGFDKTYSDSVKPLFIQILGNMSSDTASLLNLWKPLVSNKTIDFPYGDIIDKTDGHMNPVSKYYFAYSDGQEIQIINGKQVWKYSVIQAPHQLSELEYFGLITIHHDKWFSDNELYYAMEQYTNYHLNDPLDTDRGKIVLQPGLVTITPLGEEFFKIIID